MYCLDTIQSASFQAGKQIKDNHNRDSSYCKSRAGFVIHSGVHRTTAFISKDDHSEGYAAFDYWRTQGQAAINGFIEATENDLPLDACELNALAKLWPEWRFVTVKAAGASKSALVQASRSGRWKLTERLADTCPRLLHERLKSL